jgi:hypothetical protein
LASDSLVAAALLEVAMSGLRVTEQDVGGIPWLVLRGTRPDAFRELGRRAAREIGAVLSDMADLGRVRRIAASAPGATRLRGVLDASRESYPVAWTELVCMSEGASQPLEELVLLNVRGDLGLDDAHGCSDLAYNDGEHVVWGHNEDGDPSLHGKCYLVTLVLDGEVAVTFWWYPGFLPGNTFSVTEEGLMMGVDSLPVVDPPIGPGRSFVARNVHMAASPEDAYTRIKGSPSAGTFSYMIAALNDPNVIVVEGVDGRTARIDLRDSPSQVISHTNHLVALESDNVLSRSNSKQRLDVLQRFAARDHPGPGLVLALLAAEALPTGVRAVGSGGDSLTLCTIVVDLSSGSAMLQAHAGPVVSIPATDLATGISTSARVGQFAPTDSWARTLR